MKTRKAITCHCGFAYDANKFLECPRVHSHSGPIPAHTPNAHEGLLLELKFLVDAVEHGSHVDMEIALKKSKQAIAIAEGKP